MTSSLSAEGGTGVGWRATQEHVSAANATLTHVGGGQVRSVTKRFFKKIKSFLKKLLTFLNGCSIVHIVPSNGTQQNATVAQLVEYDLAKVGVAGSSPVCRSSTRFFGTVFFCIRKTTR